MKKTAMAAIVLGAVALATATAEASALVYNFKATLKTTVAKSGKIKASALTCLDESETVVYRRQGTVKVEGLIWGCDCETLSEVTGFTTDTADGCAFWDVTARKLLSGDFAWRLLNRIESSGKKAEGAWTYESECYNLTGGGFGTVKTKGRDEDMMFYVNSLSGNVAGWKCAPGLTVKSGRYIPCTFCQEGSEETEELMTAVAWSLCGCDESDDYTAVSGTWSIKYNSAATAKLNNVESIFDAYKFPDYVKSGLQTIASGNN